MIIACLIHSNLHTGLNTQRKLQSWRSIMISSVDWTVTSARCWHHSTCQRHWTLLTTLSSSGDFKIYMESNSWPSNSWHHTLPIEHTKSASIPLYRNPSLYNVVCLKAPYLALVYIVCTFIYYPRSLLSTICCTTVMQMTHSHIYLQCDNTDDAIKEAIYRLDVCTWIMNNSLKINEDETEFIIFYKNKELTSSYTLQVINYTISTCTKILGVSLDSKMALNQHISNTCRSAYYQ